MLEHKPEIVYIDCNAVQGHLAKQAWPKVYEIGKNVLDLWPKIVSISKDMAARPDMTSMTMNNFSANCFEINCFYPLQRL